MCVRIDRFGQDQTCQRSLCIDSVIVQKGFVIDVKVVSKQGQHKATLPLKGAVACAAIAPEPAQQWGYVFLEVWNFFGRDYAIRSGLKSLAQRWHRCGIGLRKNVCRAASNCEYN